MSRGVPTAVLLSTLGALACSSGAAHRSHDPAGYDAWWYPECETADGSCPTDTCLRNHVRTYENRCAEPKELDIGCVTRNTVVAGWLCFENKATGEVVVSQYAPKGGGFVSCGMGVTNFDPMLCPDGGTD